MYFITLKGEYYVHLISTQLNMYFGTLCMYSITLKGEYDVHLISTQVNMYCCTLCTYALHHLKGRVLCTLDKYIIEYVLWHTMYVLHHLKAVHIDSTRFTILALKMRFRYQANLNPFFNLYFTVKSYYK